MPVCILEDQDQFILPTTSCGREAKKRYPSLRSCSMDRGFYTPANRQKLDALLDLNVMPRKGRRTQTMSGRRNQLLWKRGGSIRPYQQLEPAESGAHVRSPRTCAHDSPVEGGGGCTPAWPDTEEAGGAARVLASGPQKGGVRPRGRHQRSTDKLLLQRSLSLGPTWCRQHAATKRLPSLESGLPPYRPHCWRPFGPRQPSKHSCLKDTPPKTGIVWLARTSCGSWWPESLQGVAAHCAEVRGPAPCKPQGSRGAGLAAA